MDYITSVMKNFPALSQCYIGKVLEPIGDGFPHVYNIQYMNYILLANH